MARPGAAFDRGRRQLADRERETNHVEQARLLLADLAVGRGDVAGEGIGGLAELLRQRLLDLGQDLVEPGILGSARSTQPAAVAAIFERS